jgi:hypothetical protein
MECISEGEEQTEREAESKVESKKNVSTEGSGRNLNESKVGREENLIHMWGPLLFL